MEKENKLIDDICDGFNGKSKAAELCEKASRLYAEKNYADAAALWRTAAEEENCAEALYYLGICYNYKLGVGGETGENCAVKAKEYFLRAAELGHAEAQCFAALCYNYGIGVEKDTEKALYWFKKSAEQNCVQAMNNL